MPEDTVEISTQARFMLALEKAYREGYVTGRLEDNKRSIHPYIKNAWHDSETKRAMES